MINETIPIQRMEELVTEIESKGLCLKSEQWTPTKDLLQSLIDAGDMLGLDISDNVEKIKPEEIELILSTLQNLLNSFLRVERENQELRARNQLLQEKANEKIKKPL